MKEDTQLLPVIKVDGIEYLVDVNHRQFREFKNPDNSISMHSVKGKQMVMDMPDDEWKCYGISAGAGQNTEV